QSGSISDNASCTPPAGHTHSVTQWFNPCAFTAPAIGTLGTFGRNVLQAQNYWNFDTSVTRQFPIHDTMVFDIEAQAFNALNHPVMSTPGGTVTSPSSFGVITSTASTQRILQLSGKFVF